MIFKRKREKRRKGEGSPLPEIMLLSAEGVGGAGSQPSLAPQAGREAAGTADSTGHRETLAALGHGQV